VPEHPVTRYAKAVTSGKELACEYVKKACRRHIRDLKRRDLFFDEKAASLALGFSRLLPHVQGDLRGKKFIPHPSQEFIIGSIFGWKTKSSGLRRFGVAYVEIPRKNAKSFLGSAIGLIGLMADNEGGAEIYSVATKKEQAMKVWSVAKSMVKMTPALSGYVRAFHNSLVYSRTDSIFKPLASDEDKLDGLNPHIVIADEIHAWPNRELWDVMEDGMGGRSQPLMAGITTAGYNQDGICYELRGHVINTLEGEKDYDDATFGYIATLDEGDSWLDPKCWKKANPLLGTAKKKEYMRKQVKLAQQLPGKENAVKNKQFDIWTKVADKWLDREGWRNLPKVKSIDELEGRHCVAAGDLSSISDLTAITYLFDGPEGYSVWPTFFLPEEKIAQKGRAPYEKWENEGWLFSTPGNVVDYDFVLQNVREMQQIFEIDEIALDPHNATQFSNNLTDEGFEVVLVPQNYTNLSAPSKELERLYLTKKIRHNGSPVLEWNIANVVLRVGPTGNVLPDKKKSAEKIDGAAALITGLARYLGREKPKESVYQRRGVRVA